MKQLSAQAATAKAIRSDLKKYFSLAKFSVTSTAYSGGNSVDISWENEPSLKEVKEAVGRYQLGHFDGMEDIYVHSNKCSDIPQAKFILCHRTVKEI